VQVLPNAANSTVLQNTVSIDWSQRQQAYGPSPPTSSVVTTVRKVATQLELSGTANATHVVPGDAVAFTISLRNTSPSNSTPVVDVRIADTLPSVLRMLSSSPPAAISTGANGETVPTWTLPTLAPGSAYSVTYTVQVERVFDRTSIHNAATFTAYSQDGRDHYTGAQMVVLIIGVPEIIVTETSSTTSASPGDVVSFTISVVNNGQSPAFDVVVDEHIPAEMEFVSASGQCSLDQSLSIVSWTIPRLDPAQSAGFTVSLRVRSVVGEGVTITGEATSQWQDRNRNSYGPSSAHCALTTRSPADIRIVQTVNPNTGVRPGAIVTFNLEVTNVGEGVAKDIIVTDLLPTGLTYRIGSSYLLLPDNAASNIAPEVFANGSLRWSISANLLPSNRFVLMFAARVSEKARGPIHNVVLANSTYAKAIVPLLVPSVIATKTSDVSKAERGGEVVYTIELYNAGNDTANAIAVHDSLPMSLQYVAGSSRLEGQQTGDPRQDGGTLTWQLAVPLAPGQRLTLSFSAVVVSQATGPIVNSARITCDGVSTEVTSGPLEILVPSLIASKSASAQTVTVGGAVSFTIVVTNVGNGTAYGVTVTDFLPSSLGYVAGSSTLNGSALSDPQVLAGSELAWSIVDPLRPGQTIVLSLTAVPSPTGQLSAVRSMARVDWEDSGGNRDHIVTEEVSLGVRQVVTSVVALLLAAGPLMMLMGRRSRIVLSDGPLFFLVRTGTIGHLKELYSEIWVAPLVVDTAGRRLGNHDTLTLDGLIRDRTLLVSTKEKMAEAPGLSDEDVCSLVVAAEKGAELCPTSSEALTAAADLRIPAKDITVLMGQMYLKGLVSDATLQELTTRLWEFKT